MVGGWGFFFFKETRRTQNRNLRHFLKVYVRWLNMDGSDASSWKCASLVLEEVFITTGFTYPVVLLHLQEFLDRRKMTEFGSLALVDEGAGDGDGVSISLPGVRRGTNPHTKAQTSYYKCGSCVFATRCSGQKWWSLWSDWNRQN